MTSKPGVGCCSLLKLEYYSSENLLKFMYNKTLIFPASFLPQFDKKAEIYNNHGLLSSKIITKWRYLVE